MVRYFCDKCRYRFSPKAGSKIVPRVCPYCGKAGSIRAEEPVDSMIRNVDDMIDL